MPTAFNNSPIREHSNEIDRYYDHDINVGGPIKKDKVWFFGTYRQQFNAVAQPNFTFDKTFDTKLWNAVGKVTYQVNQKNKFIGYYQWGQKEQPNRLPFATYTYTSPEQTFAQDSGSWVYKGEWNSTVSDKLYLEARYGDFGYYFPLITNSPDNFFWHDTGRAGLGRRAPEAAARSRSQAVQPARRPTSSTPRKGSHTFKFGARAAEGTVVGRLRVAPRRHEQHRADLQQRRLDAGDLRHPDRDLRGRHARGARLLDVAQRRSIRSARSSTTRGRSAR